MQSKRTAVNCVSAFGVSRVFGSAAENTAAMWSWDDILLNMCLFVFSDDENKGGAFAFCVLLLVWSGLKIPVCFLHSDGVNVWTPGLKEWCPMSAVEDGRVRVWSNNPTFHSHQLFWVQVLRQALRLLHSDYSMGSGKCNSFLGLAFLCHPIVVSSYLS